MSIQGMKERAFQFYFPLWQELDLVSHASVHFPVEYITDS